jgi:hypothetical protein
LYAGEQHLFESKVVVLLMSHVWEALESEIDIRLTGYEIKYAKQWETMCQFRLAHFLDWKPAKPPVV